MALISWWPVLLPPSFWNPLHLLTTLWMGSYMWLLSVPTSYNLSKAFHCFNEEKTWWLSCKGPDSPWWDSPLLSSGSAPSPHRALEGAVLSTQKVLPAQPPWPLLPARMERSGAFSMWYFPGHELRPPNDCLPARPSASLPNSFQT